MLMPIPLMRENLRPLMHSLTTAHAGLLIQRALPVWEDGEKPQKQALVQTIAAVKPDDIYNLAFKRWLKLTTESDDFATTVATLNGRLFTGLPLGGTLDTGVSTHHTYGMPLLAGSSIKGAVCNYAQSIGIDAKVIEVLFGSDDDTTPNAGYLTWHDAWWIPNTSIQTPFVKEIVTVHHQQYYNGTKQQANDTESPTPNVQTAVQGSFYFAIEGVHAWVEYAKQLLENMLTEQGLGSKTASGYGYFTTDDNVSGKIDTLYHEMLIGNTKDPYLKMKIILQNLDEEALILALSKKGRTKFYTEFELELDKGNEEDVIVIMTQVWAAHSAIIETWKGNKSSNTADAYKYAIRHKPN